MNNIDSKDNKSINVNKTESCKATNCYDLYNLNRYKYCYFILAFFVLISAILLTKLSYSSPNKIVTLLGDSITEINLAALIKGTTTNSNVKNNNVKINLAELPAEKRKNYLNLIRSGKLFVNQGPNHLHGDIGLDDNGLPGYNLTKLTDEEIANMNVEKELVAGGGFNVKLSDSISLDRVPKDNRPAECKLIEFNYSKLKSASVVIIFHNEAQSILYRTLHSILNNSPPNLLDEIILINDGSTVEWIGENSKNIKAYIELLPKIRYIDLKERTGIVRARLTGIRACKSPIFVVLDSHVEVQPNWLEHLVQKISEDETSIVLPTIDSLHADDLTYGYEGVGCTVGMIWKGCEHAYNPHDFKNLTFPDRLSDDPTTYISSPTMTGGLFSADKKHFLYTLGGYDEKYKDWGAENLELSFRSWMCGGKILCSKCGRAYHIFRQGGHAYSSPPNSYIINKLRLANSWMDGFGELLWRVNNKITIDYGDISNVLDYRVKKNCKSFKWYLNNIWPESFVRDYDDVPHLGYLKSVESNKYLAVQNPHSPSNQSYYLSDEPISEFMYFKRPGFIMPVVNDESCLDEDNLVNGDWCHINKQVFKVEQVDNYYKIIGKQNTCLSVQNNSIAMSNCNSSKNAYWEWPEFRLNKNFRSPIPAS